MEDIPVSEDGILILISILNTISPDSPEYDIVESLIGDFLKNIEVSEETAISILKWCIKTNYYGLLTNLHDNETVLIEAIFQNNFNLKYASKRLQSNYDIVRLSVCKNGLELEYASEELQQNFDIVLYAVKNNGLALEFAHEDLRHLKIIGLFAVRNKGNALQYVLGDLLQDQDVIHAALTNDASSALYII